MVYRENAKIAYAKGWSTATVILATVLMSLNSILCCGIVGYAIMQQIASSELSKYGLRTGGFLGLKKRELQAMVERMRQEESGAVAAPPYVLPTAPPV